MKSSKLVSGLAGILALAIASAPIAATAGGRGYGNHGKYGHNGYSGGHYKQGYGHGYSGGRNHYRHNSRRHYGHRGHGGSGWVPFAVIGGLAAGYLISESSHRNRATTYSTTTTYHGASTRPCHVVHKIDSVDGYEVKSAATMCYDAGGYAYIVQGSELVID